VRELKSHGASVVYISHHLEETFEGKRPDHGAAGRAAGLDQPTQDLNVDKLIRYMVGRDLSEKFPKEAIARGAEVLRVEGLSQEDRLRDISFSAYAGEVLGIAGLVGAGRTELVRAIFGADPIDGGEIYVDGKRASVARRRTPSERDRVVDGGSPNSRDFACDERP
jgi:ribose transport system ATP-binding protein